MATPPRKLPHESLFYLVLPPLIWFGYFLLVYAVVAVGCAFDIQAQWFGVSAVQFLGVLLTVSALMAVGAIGLSGFGRSRQARDLMKGRETTEDPDNDRARFLALVGLLLSVLSLVATVWVGLAILMVPPCA